MFNGQIQVRFLLIVVSTIFPNPLIGISPCNTSSFWIIILSRSHKAYNKHLPSSAQFKQCLPPLLSDSPSPLFIYSPQLVPCVCSHKGYPFPIVFTTISPAQNNQHHSILACFAMSPVVSVELSQWNKQLIAMYVYAPQVPHRMGKEMGECFPRKDLQID